MWTKWKKMGWTMEKEVGQNERERVDRMKEKGWIE